VLELGATCWCRRSWTFDVDVRGREEGGGKEKGTETPSAVISSRVAL